MTTFKQRREFESTIRSLVSSFGLIFILVTLIRICHACHFEIEMFLSSVAESLEKAAALAEQENDLGWSKAALHYAQSIREIVPSEPSTHQSVQA